MSMVKLFNYRLVALLLVLLTGSNAAMAQYDPDNPPEPSVRYKVKVSVSPSDAGYASGAGTFFRGETTTISTSKKAGYDFMYWTKNGEIYSYATNFSYTIENENADFVAVYQYNPDSPSDPVSSPTYRLYVDSSPSDACSFNITSGMKAKSGTWVNLSARANQGFEFQGWYEGENLISEQSSFSYQMEAKDTYLTAQYIYNPDNPGDPASKGTNIDNGEGILGDVNGDGAVTVTDAVIIVNIILGKNTNEAYEKAADLNKDGNVNVTDVVMTINIILGN